MMSSFTPGYKTTDIWRKITKPIPSYHKYGDTALG